MTAEAKFELTAKLKAGEFRTTGQAEACLKEIHQIEFGTHSIYYQLGKSRRAAQGPLPKSLEER